jgi:hypothetical protein
MSSGATRPRRSFRRAEQARSNDSHDRRIDALSSAAAKATRIRVDSTVTRAIDRDRLAAIVVALAKVVLTVV